MSNFPILCLICNQTLKGDEAYLQHMQTTHSDLEQAKERNIPKDVPAIVLNKNAPLSPEFAEVAAMMDQPKHTPPLAVPPETKVSPVLPQREVQTKPIVLKYKYEGTCLKDNTAIKTIMVKVNGQLVANGYCMACDEVKQQRNVHPLEENTGGMSLQKKEEKKHGK